MVSGASITYMYVCLYIYIYGVRMYVRMDGWIDEGFLGSIEGSLGEFV